MAVTEEKLPRHVAIIMDGNGRWARSRALPRIEGHIVGMESVRDIVIMTRGLNIPYLTLYAFSKENWSRPREEVKGLLGLLAVYLDSELPLMMDNDVKFGAIGAVSDLPEELQQHLQRVSKITEKNSSLHLNVALSYSGREEILHAARMVAKDMANGVIDGIDEQAFNKYLYTAGMPDPDLLIRTSGEMRLSNFLLWQLAYTEIYVTETLWPDFRREAYQKALDDFTGRERRFGSLKEE
ncbi:MAG: Ditrans,polycis-undecaprenyl-diphosphate synthase ((2E,6E)-farnesyl-diphosphate specific) [Syntrophorhabdaceae bacterium PtaU1.Bin034]|nr:MAG: Ditrans,polycis-undecaprenyl-diphosphate synthase ((2E,6E)-farnesyl-diphosphate specific) [Syntrophorhabdaceae bacterium PtaU1.Bin034]